MSDELEEEIEIFAEESYDLLDGCEEGLIEIDKGGDFKSNYDAIFRAFHSIKGGAGMLGLERIQSVMHHLEDLLTSQKDEDSLAEPLVNYFLLGVDFVRKSFDGNEPEFELIDPMAGANGAAPAVEETSAESSQTEVIPLKLEGVESDKPLVYVIDDEPDIRDILADMLLDNGYEVKTYANGREAIDRVKNDKPEVILCDMVMDEMDGMEFIENLRKIDQDIPVLFVSGNLSLTICQEALDYGAFAFIDKPFQEPKVMAQVTRAHDSFRLKKLLEKSMNFILFQYPDIESFLMSKGKKDECQLMKEEMDHILRLRRQLRQTFKARGEAS